MKPDFGRRDDVDDHGATTELSAQVERLERRHAEAMALLGEIIPTFRGIRDQQLIDWIYRFSRLQAKSDAIGGH